MGLFGIFGKKKESDNGEFLKFDNYPFKLLVIQVLMYDKKLLKPEYLGGDQFFEKNPDLDELSEKEAISRLEKHIKSANEYFQSLKIPSSMAKEITSLYSGGELDVYYNINPQWQDYDEYFEDGKMFDVTDISEAEIKQFPNLKSIVFNMYHDAPAALIGKLHGWGIETEAEE